jgi:3-hydroxyacyl-[acyl-carrier-protein] dehydratase
MRAGGGLGSRLEALGEGRYGTRFRLHPPPPHPTVHRPTMPLETLFDLAQLDRTRTLHGREELDKHLAQRGTFQVVDRIVWEDAEQGLVIGAKEILADDWWAAGHIPGRPMFPGALMIETAAQIASFDYSRHRIPADAVGKRFVGFGGVDNARFRGLVTPGCTMFFVVKLLRSGSRMFRYATQAFLERDGQLEPTCVFEAEVMGVIV